MRGLLVLGAIALLAGCANRFTGVCAAAPIGQTDSGITALRVHCEADK